MRFRLFSPEDSVHAGQTSFVVTTDAKSSFFGDDKVVREARDDAASFVASGGAIRGVRLEAALRHVRSKQPELQADDMGLAQAILAL